MEGRKGGEGREGRECREGREALTLNSTMSTGNSLCST